MDVIQDTCARRGFLLCICLFVLKAAANCPLPKASEEKNTVLTSEALLMNEFPEGSAVTFECATGHVNESGSDTINCVGGAWTEQDLVCKKMDCGPPKPQPNMSFRVISNTLFGGSVQVICDHGYYIHGSAYKQCYASGWGGRAKCKSITCQKPAEVANGIVKWNSQTGPERGQSIQFVCNEGYTLIGSAIIVCTANGTYDYQPPECKSVTTEDRVATKIITSSAAPPQQEFSSMSTTDRGGRGILAPEDNAASTTVTSTTMSLGDKLEVAGETFTHNRYLPVAIAVICVALVVIVLVFGFHKFLQRKKGSYDTREDLKPELLQFQNL